MPRAIFKLRFSTAVRIGSDDGGASLADARMGFHADTLFSALYLAALPMGEAEHLLKCVSGGDIAFSDGLPWKGDTLYLPKPVGVFGEARADYDPSKRKLYKRIKYIPLDALEKYMRGEAEPEALEQSFGVTFEEVRVNVRDFDKALPYRVGGFRFADDCGLYVLVNAASDEALALMERAMRALGAEGMGGKASSGWGKFELDISPVCARLDIMFNDACAPKQMLLSVALPEPDALETALNEGFFTLVRRGGFSRSDARQPMKKRTMYLMDAGSVFSARFEGMMCDVGQHMPHAVWRCCRALFLGVRA